MITIPKSIQKAIQDGENPQKELEQHLLTYPITEIIQAFAELLISTENTINKNPIVISQDEFDTIMSLFKVRGVRVVDGIVCEETRGRRSKKIYKG